MRHLPKTISCTVLVLVATLALAGCGGDSPATVAPIVLNTPAFSDSSLPARFTCDGRDISPPLFWGAVPAHTRQLVLFLIAFVPQASGRYAASIEWAVAGLNPALHGLPAGRLPSEAYLGVASDDKRQPYRICPRKGTHVHYQFEVYAVPDSEGISRDFAALPVLTALTAPSSPLRAKGHGAFVATYTRR
jgi:phosphatidylethanolamine-binding protein (PEBP) family uncharacterized protein